MPTVFITTPNLLLFNVRVEFFFIDKENFVPFGYCNIKNLLETLNRFDIRTITAEYHTTNNAKTRKADLVRYTKRLQVLDRDWTYTPWVHKTLGDHVMFNILQSTLTKKDGI